MKTAAISLVTAAGLFMVVNAISQTPNPSPPSGSTSPANGSALPPDGAAPPPGGRGLPPNGRGLPPNGAAFPPAANVTVTPSGRITAPAISEMNEFQKSQYEGSVRMGGGPRMPLINSLPILEAWNGMQVALSGSSLPSKLRELSIVVVGAYWKSEFEWRAHSQQAVRAGVSAAAVEAIRKGQEPVLATDEEKIVYRYAHELVVNHQVSDAAYNAAWKLLGTRNLVELTVLLGHYTSVAMTLNAHKVPLPDGEKNAF